MAGGVEADAGAPSVRALPYGTDSIDGVGAEAAGDSGAARLRAEVGGAAGARMIAGAWVISARGTAPQGSMWKSPAWQ